MIKVGKLYRFTDRFIERSERAVGGYIYVTVCERQKAYDTRTMLVVMLAITCITKAQYMVRLLLPDGLVGELLAEQGWFEEINS